MNDVVPVKPEDGDESIETSLIEGGDVRDVVDEDVYHRRHHVRTASRIGMILVWMLGGSFLLNYLGKIALEVYGKHDAAKELSDDFKVWLPVVSSLVASAVTYYFSKDKEAQ